MKAELELLGVNPHSGCRRKAIIPCELESLDGTLDFENIVDEFIRTSHQFYILRRTHPDKFCPQEECIVEECSEFMKEYVKKNRGKSSKERLNEECADMIVAALNYLMWNGMALRDIFSYGTEKTQRAIDRFNKNGEV